MCLGEGGGEGGHFDLALFLRNEQNKKIVEIQILETFKNKYLQIVKQTRTITTLVVISYSTDMCVSLYYAKLQNCVPLILMD